VPASGGGVSLLLGGITMTMKKAREILKEHAKLNFVDKNPDLKAAMKLGIEALKWIEKWKSQLVEEGFSLLPVDTEE